MSKKYSGQERRKSPRLSIKLAVLYQIDKPLFVRMHVGDKEVLATTLDLSESGLGILTDYNIPIQTMLAITLTLYCVNADDKVDSYGPMKLMGEVRANASLEEKRHRLGICFTEISEENRSAVSHFVNVLLGKA